MVSSPVEFFSRTAPPAGRSACRVFVTGSSASNTQLKPKISVRILLISSSGSVLALIKIRRRFWQNVVLSGYPDIDGRQQEDAHDQSRNQSANNHDGEGPL